jgi:hypothetical protein
MERNHSKGASGSAATQADETRTDQPMVQNPDQDPDQDRRQRHVRLLEFLAWRSLGVRTALSRAKRRAHGRKFGPIKSIAAL